MQIISYVIATLIPLLALYIIYTLDMFKMGSFRFVLACFAAGGIAFAAASKINAAVYNLDYFSYDTMVRFFAPILEEILKALILIYLVRRTDFTYFVDGAIYGFAAGMGFAIFENYQYISSAYGAEVMTAVSRVISTNLIHASCSAIVGIGFGLSRFQKGFRWAGVLFGPWALAMTIHVIFNNMVTRDLGNLLLLYAAVMGFISAGVIIFAMQRGLDHEKAWIEEKLGMTDRVTEGEARIVQRFGDMQDLLAPLAERFGVEKAAKIEKFLTTQARLGIQRKTLEMLTDDKMRAAVEKQMIELRKEMDIARREVGSYAMLYLRHTMPADTSPLWGRLQNLIQERAAVRPATGGMNLWANLEQRSTKAAETEVPPPPATTPPEMQADTAATSTTPTPAMDAPTTPPPPAPRSAAPGGIFAKIPAKGSSTARPGEVPEDKLGKKPDKQD